MGFKPENLAFVKMNKIIGRLLLFCRGYAPKKLKTGAFRSLIM